MHAKHPFNDKNEKIVSLNIVSISYNESRRCVMDLKLFESERLRFRGFNEKDFTHLFGVLGNEEVCEYLPGDKPYTEEQVKRVLTYFINTFVIEKKNLHYAVELKDTNEFIGYCGCSYIKEYECNEIEYFLQPDFFGNGYASEMALMMKQVAFELGLTYLVGLADLSNVPSQKILEKIGYLFKEEVEHWGLKLKLYELKIKQED